MDSQPLVPQQASRRVQPVVGQELHECLSPQLPYEAREVAFAQAQLLCCAEEGNLLPVPPAYKIFGRENMALPAVGTRTGELRGLAVGVRAGLLVPGKGASAGKFKLNPGKGRFQLRVVYRFQQKVGNPQAKRPAGIFKIVVAGYDDRRRGSGPPEAVYP
jgi:hypothetical protein